MQVTWALFSHLYGRAAPLSLLLLAALCLQGCGQSSTSASAGVPGAPTAITALVGNGSALVRWIAPADGGSAITGYTVIANPGPATITVPGTTTSALVPGLTNGTSYTFTVIASNAMGSSAVSASSAAVTPVAVPGSPTGVTVIQVGNQSAKIGWTAPASDGSPITGYTVTATSTLGDLTANGAAGTTSLEFPGLTNGSSYTFTVTASNAVGTSLPSAPSSAVVPATVPDAPTAVQATPGDSSVLVSWTAPADNGSLITGYTVTSSPGGFTASAGAGVSSATVGGLTNGVSYTFTVVATNGAGNSLPSTASATVTPASVPGAPTAVTAAGGDSSAVVNWVAPVAMGISPISGYTVTSNPGGFTASAGAGASTATVGGLSNGVSYTFTVVATNSAGNSLPSSPSNAVTPATVPGSPTGVQAAAGNNSAVVSWVAPSNNGGSAITGYLVTESTGGVSGVPQSAGPLATSLNFTGLANGTTYTFTVIATNAVGNSAPSNASGAVTPAMVPDTPTNVAATAGNAKAVVTWTAPASNGNTILTYTVTPSSGNPVVVTAPATSTTVTGLTNGTSYTFTVFATNSMGNSPPSAPSAAVIPATVPGAPIGVTASPGNATALVGWTAPASNGGSAITAYSVKASGITTPQSAAAAARSLTFTGLTNGTSYTFTVTAANALGSSVASAASPPVTPAATSVTITLSPRQAGITLSQTQQYTATVTGNSNTAVTWKVDGTAGGNATTLGTISATGLYTPPTAGVLAGAHIISATSQADISKVASATLGVTDLASVPTYHNDIARTGQNLQEYALTPANVASSFGKLFSCPVDGVVYAQPLYVANLNVTGFGVHNVVFVVTMKDSLYAFDADNPACVTYWYQNFLPVGAVPVPVTDATSAGDVPGTFGIMGTPVIGNSNIYFVDRYRTPTPTPPPPYTYTEQLHAVNIATGLEIAGSPVTISPTVSGNSQGLSLTTVTFNPLTQAQRPALLLLGTNVYAAFGSAGDNGNYNGWLVGYDTTSLAQTAVFNSVPNGGAVAQGGQGAFWMCGGGPASDGTSIYVATANGLFDNTANAVPPVAPLNDMGDSLLKLSPSLAIQDFFTPFDQATDYTTDLDFGSGGVIVLPNSMGGASHPHLVIATGKPGKLYMDDRDAMARYQRGNGGTDANVQTVPVATAANTGLWATPAIWGSNLYIAGYSATLKAFPVINGTIGAFSAQSADAFQGGGATPSVSAMGTGQTAANNAIVWTLDNSNNGATFGFSYGPAILRAYDATNVATRLYASSTLAADAAGNAVKFTVPTVANGKVYVAGGQAGSSVGTTGQLTVYGLKP